MQIVVCCKRVPDTAEADVQIDSSGSGIVTDRLVYTLNEADNYALEEALLIREKHGGSIVLISVGPRAAEEVLRMGLAKGADRAVRIDDAELVGADASVIARLLSRAIEPLKPDLILCGSQASDDGQGLIGVMLAARLGLPHAAYVSRVGLREQSDVKTTAVWRELEGGLLEKNEIPLPAVITVQTGINTPRYASIMGIKRAQAKELKVATLGDLGAGPADTVPDTELVQLAVPKAERHAEMLTGDVNESSARLAAILKERGLV